MYRERPVLPIETKVKAVSGYLNILKEIVKEGGKQRIVIETYPGVDKEAWKEAIEKNYPEAQLIDTDDLYQSPQKIFADIADDLTSDNVFGRFSHKDFKDYLDYQKIQAADVLTENGKLRFIIGAGGVEATDYDVFVYADIPRWEIQQRFKKGLSNWQGYKEEQFSEKLKRAYYFEWPAADALKERWMHKSEYYIDCTKEEQPKLIKTAELRAILSEFAKQPFRLVPYFDPGVWGGEWLQEKFQMGQEKVNLAWGFDGVPEENSLLAGIVDNELEIPAQNLVLWFPKELLGQKVYGRFGKDFPIRFDYLDTMNGQNLSLQVHPTLDYAYRTFGAKYTQDESYYILDCQDEACVYLGVKNETDIEELVGALEEAQTTGRFEAERYINTFPVKKHDHFLIPGGTIHSSGKNCVVLEISATPNRFTFKLWDWERVDLDGKPRPISIEHGKQVINPAFDEAFARRELINAEEIQHQETGFSEVHTGLHRMEAIETRRLTFSKLIRQRTEESVNMLNLVEGTQIFVKSLAAEFQTFPVSYGETFVIPEQVGEYLLEPAVPGEEVKVMKAYIR